MNLPLIILIQFIFSERQFLAIREIIIAKDFTMKF